MTTKTEALPPQQVVTPTLTGSPLSSRTLKTIDSSPSSPSPLKPSTGLSIPAANSASYVGSIGYQIEAIPRYSGKDSGSQPQKPPSPLESISRISFSPGEKSLSSGFFTPTETGSSYSSSGFLTPPLFQGDTDSPPYKAPVEESSGLSWIPSGEKKSSPLEARQKSRNRRYRHHHEPRRSSHNRSRTYYVAPTASSQLRDLSKHRIGKHRPRHFSCGNLNTSAKSVPRSKRNRLPPVVSRRWSSVEIGTHRVPLGSTLPNHSSSGSVVHTPLTERLNRVYRSSSFTPGVADHDILRTVRERLTSRKVPESKPPLMTPATITLRRASGTSKPSRCSVPSELMEDIEEAEDTGSDSQNHNLRPMDKKSMFLITNQDIDSITDLIEANLKKGPRSRTSLNPQVQREPRSVAGISRTMITASVDSSAAPPRAQLRRTWSSNRWSFSRIYSPSKRSGAPSFTVKGMVPQPSAPTQATSEAAEVQLPTFVDFVDSNGLLRVVKPRHPLPGSGGQGISDVSAHEVIWEPDESPVATEDDASIPSSQEEFRTPFQDTYRGDAFDPGNARHSISEWSMKLPPPEIQVFITPHGSVSSISNDVAPNEEDTNFPADSVSHSLSVIRSDTDIRRASQVNTMHSFDSATPAVPEDVVSFPPLSTRPTNDWISPLPSIKHASSPDSTSSHHDGHVPKGHICLHDEGIDATGSLGIETRDSDSELHSSNYQDMPTAAFSFNPDYQMRRKSVVKSHPKASARVGSPNEIGSSIGCSSGERRKSSDRGNQTQHAEVIDNINRPSNTHAGTWSKARPPTPNVSIRPISPPAEDSSGDDSPGYGSTRKIVRSGHSGHVDQMARIQDSSPPTQTTEFIGIHERLTGARQVDGHESCGRDCKKHQRVLDPRRASSNPSVDWVG